MHFGVLMKEAVLMQIEPLHSFILYDNWADMYLVMQETQNF